MDNPFLKVSDAGLETLARTYKSESGNSLVFTPTVHVGLEEYYKNIVSMLNKQDVVLCEGIMSETISDKHSSSLGDVNKEELLQDFYLMNSLRFTDLFQLLMSKWFGITAQIEHVPPQLNRDKWISADMRMSDLLNASIAQREDYHALAAGALGNFYSLIRDLSFDRETMKEGYSYFFESVASSLNDNSSYALDEVRESKIGELLPELEGKDIGVAYGAMHALNIEKVIINNGYSMSSEESLLALPSEPPSLSFLK